jgi:hypothetical protein
MAHFLRPMHGAHARQHPGVPLLGLGFLPGRNSRVPPVSQGLAIATMLREFGRTLRLAQGMEFGTRGDGADEAGHGILCAV